MGVCHSARALGAGVARVGAACRAECERRVDRPRAHQRDGCRRTGEVLDRRFRLVEGVPLDHVGHHRSRRLADRAAAASKRDFGDPILPLVDAD